MTVTESPSSSERAVLTRRVLLLSRHAHEEYEHKAVAFDVFQTVSGSHRIRVGVMNAVTAAFIGGAVFVAALALLTGRRARNPRRPRRDPARIGRQGSTPVRRLSHEVGRANGRLLHFFYTFQSDGVVRRGTLRECSSAKVQLRGTARDALVRAGMDLVDLITRRSQVQILPPPPSRGPESPGIPGLLVLAGRIVRPGF